MRSAEGKLVIEDIETRTLDTDALVSQLGHELRRNYVDPNELSTLLESLGATKLSTYIRDYKLPEDLSVRHGDFGEAIGSALLRHSKRFCLPVLKLRYKTRADKSLFGLDIVAFRFTSDPPTVLVAEVKTHTSRQKKLDLGKNAYEQLDESLTEKSLGQAISFIYARIAGAGGRGCLATRLALLLDSQSERKLERHLLIWHEKNVWDERVVERTVEAAKDGAAAQMSVIQVEDLATLIALAYDAAKDLSDAD